MADSGKKWQEASRKAPELRQSSKRSSRARRGHPVQGPADDNLDDMLTSGWWLLPLGILGMVFWGVAIWFALF